MTDRSRGARKSGLLLQCTTAAAWSCLTLEAAVGTVAACAGTQCRAAVTREWGRVADMTSAHPHIVMSHVREILSLCNNVLEGVAAVGQTAPMGKRRDMRKPRVHRPSCRDAVAGMLSGQCTPAHICIMIYVVTCEREYTLSLCNIVCARRCVWQWPSQRPPGRDQFWGGGVGGGGERRDWPEIRAGRGRS